MDFVGFDSPYPRGNGGREVIQEPLEVPRVEDVADGIEALALDLLQEPRGIFRSASGHE